MTEYLICFDFPEAPDPWFAAQLRAGMGFVSSLTDAARFGTQEIAERVLQNGYGDSTRPYGTVVEIGT